MQAFLKRFEFPLFCLLSYLLSWWLVPVMNGAILPQGPLLAALLLTGLTLGRRGLAAYWKQLTNWQAGWWYVVGPLVIVGYSGLALLINLLFGARFEAPPLLSLAVFGQLLLFGGQWEEPGWTGYALPRLEAQFADRPYGQWLAVLLVGCARALWHLPLFLAGKLYWFEIFVFSFAVQVIITWLYHRSGRSVPAVMAFHLASNVFGAMLRPVFAGADQLRFYALFMGLALLFAVWLAGFARRWSQPTEAPRHAVI